MNAEQCAIVQRLISHLDDTHSLYLKLEPLLIHAHVRYLVSRMIDLHSASADDLARQMKLAGGLSARRGRGTLAWLRAQATYWMAIASGDSEMTCLNSIVRQECRMARRFQATMAQVSDLHQNSALHQNLHDQLLALQCTGYQIESLARQMEASSAGAPHMATTVANMPDRARLRR